MNYKERCQDCAYLIEVEGRWFCDDKQKFCEDVNDCLVENSFSED